MLWMQNGAGTGAAGLRRELSNQWLEGLMFLEACLGFFGLCLVYPQSVLLSQLKGASCS